MNTISIPSEAPGTERRAHPRYPCQAGVEIKVSNAAPQWGVTTDLSRFGCYVETPSPLAPGKEVLLTFTLFERSFTAKAVVVVSHPMFGMGMKFMSAAAEDISVLEDWLRRLAAEATASAAKATPLTKGAPIPARGPLVVRLSGENAIKILEQMGRVLAEKKVISLAEFEALVCAKTPHEAMPL